MSTQNEIHFYILQMLVAFDMADGVLNRIELLNAPVRPPLSCILQG